MKALFIASILLLIAAISALWTAVSVTEYLCTGYTAPKGGTRTADQGRLRLSEYRWWLLWTKSDGDVLFQGRQFDYFYALKLSRAGGGSMAVFVASDTDKAFLFKRATGELLLNDAAQAFDGECAVATSR